AADCIAIPAELNRLGFLLNLYTHRLRPAVTPSLPSPVKSTEAVGQDRLDHLMEQVRRVAPQEITLLLTGETGTGKTRLARLIHDMYPRLVEHFLDVDCGILSDLLTVCE